MISVPTGGAVSPSDYVTTSPTIAPTSSSGGSTNTSGSGASFAPTHTVPTGGAVSPSDYISTSPLKFAGDNTTTVLSDPTDLSGVLQPTGAITSPYDSTTVTTTEPSALDGVLAALASLFGSSASGGSGAASPGASTAFPVSPDSSSSGSPMPKLLLLVVVVGVAYYGYKKGWFRKLTGTPAAA